jgi:hypothetical protein
MLLSGINIAYIKHNIPYLTKTQAIHVTQKGGEEDMHI